MAKKNLILAFESSCDETSVAVIEDGQKILSNIVATQILSHQRFGGVVPEVAIVGADTLICWAFSCKLKPRSIAHIIIYQQIGRAHV